MHQLSQKLKQISLFRWQSIMNNFSNLLIYLICIPFIIKSKTQICQSQIHSEINQKSEINKFRVRNLYKQIKSTYLKMNIKAAFIASLIYDIEQSYKNYTLSENGQADLRKTINELCILSIIYQECSQTNRQIIDAQLLKFQIKLRQQIYNSGGFWNTISRKEIKVVNLDQFWPQICKIQQPQCQHLIEDIRQLKTIK